MNYKTDKDILDIINKSRDIVKLAYSEDSRLTKDSGPNSSLARESNIVFKEVLRYLLNEDA